MARDGKKRKASTFSIESDIQKRKRQPSTRAFILSQQDDRPHASREKSVFRGEQDPYFPSKAEKTAMHMRDGYLFRLKIISTATDLTNDVFSEAVQGLVKICFPQDVLDELGLRVLEDHMCEEGAPRANIERMKEVFRAEMIHRVTWMLAEYLDTPARVEAVVRSIIAASAKLHTTEPGYDILGTAIAEIGWLRSRFPGNSTASVTTECHLADQGQSEAKNAEGQVNSLDSKSSGATRSSLNMSTVSSKDKAVRSSQKTKKRGGPPKPASSSSMMTETEKTPNGGTTIANEELLVATTKRNDSISPKWEWDIDPVQLSVKQILEVFKATNDLFAYHALPIAKRRLRPGAKRKAIRHEMQSMLIEMPDDEYERWVESFRKLHDGDQTMLIRNTLA